MTAAEFRRLALALPETSEESHMDHPDFRVGGKIFATLGPGEEWGMVKLTLEQQAAYVAAAPAAFRTIAGGWGRKGATKVEIGEASAADVQEALLQAWCNTAPKRLARQYAEEIERSRRG